MFTKNSELPATWKCPNEILKLQRLKQKQKQLTARLSQSKNNINVAALKHGDLTDSERHRLLEAKIAQKRRNPFAKSIAEIEKKSKNEEFITTQQEDAAFEFLNSSKRAVSAAVEKQTPSCSSAAAKLVPQPFDANVFAKLMQDNTHIATDDDDVALEKQQQTKHLPMDWSLKTRARFFCPSELPSTTLKTSQLASGMTSFVRCIDTKSTGSGLDISPATRFSAGTYYWQHPYIPWLTLFPRNSKNNMGFTLGDVERQALLDDWDYSFGGLFHLLRARQCPYFYVCANTFTVLFRAAGTASCDEMHALMTPSTRGLRSLLRQEGIEYTMPLKRESNLNRSADTNGTESAETMQNNNSKEELEDEDEAEEEQWLESLGVDDKEIKRMQSTHSRQLKAKEMQDDFSDNSLLLIEGVECQGFFSFLLNAKSTISTSGRLAGVPPTLLAPVAFPKATMQQLSTRSNIVRMDGVDYCSIEVKGIVLPSFLPYVCSLLGESKDTFSVTLASSNNTLAFTKATQMIVENLVPSDDTDSKTISEQDNMGRGVFGQENLSDSGLLPCVIEALCRTGKRAVALLERVCYDSAHGYAWS